MKTRFLFGLPFVTFSIQKIEIEAVVDTGFNGMLMLPKETIRKLHLRPIASSGYILANGQSQECNVYKTEMQWLGKMEKVLIIESDSDLSLVGIDLLYNTTLTIKPSKEYISIERMELH